MPKKCPYANNTMAAALQALDRNIEQSIIDLQKPKSFPSHLAVDQVHPEHNSLGCHHLSRSLTLHRLETFSWIYKTPPLTFVETKAIQLTQQSLGTNEEPLLWMGSDF